MRNTIGNRCFRIDVYGSASWVVMAMTLAASGPALAQVAAKQDAAQSTTELVEIVVTAQFRSQDMQKTPLSITAVNAKALDERGQFSVAQVAAEAPSVIMAPSTGVAGPSLATFIRGTGQSDFIPGESPGVGMYIDDVYYGSILGSNFALIDLDRVEILRGPQGTLSGQNSIGGSVKLFSKRPDANEGGSLEVTGGSYNDAELRGAADMVLIPDQLFLRVSGATKHQDGYVDRYDYGCTHPGSGVPSSVTGSNCVLGHEGGTSYTGGRVALRWLASDKLEVNFSADYTNDNSEASAQTLLYAVPVTAALNKTNSIAGIRLGNATGSPFITSSPLGPYAQDTYSRSPYVSYGTFCDAAPSDGSRPYCDPTNDQTQNGGVSGVIDYKFTDHLSLKSITAFRSLHSTWANDESASPVSDYLNLNHINEHQVTEELRLSGDVLDKKVNYTVGGFYMSRNETYNARIDTASFEFLEDDRVPDTTSAAFVNADWHATDKFDLNAGLRYTQQRLTYNYGRGGVPGSVAGGIYQPCAQAGGVILATPACLLLGTSASASSSRLDYRLAPQYQWTPNFMTYLSFSTGFKSGGVNARPLTLGQEQSFGPETIDAYEAGFKTTVFDGSLRLNGAVFYNFDNQMQITVQTCPQFGPAPACALPFNAGNAIVSGAELEGQWRATEALRFDTSVSYLNFHFRSLSADAIASGITTSMTEPFAPTWKASFGAQYEIKVGALGSVTPRMDASYQTDMETTLPNSQFTLVPGYTLVNAGAIWRPNGDKWQVNLLVKNVQNKVYYYNTFNNTSSSHTVMGNPAPPREFSLSVRRTF